MQRIGFRMTLKAGCEQEYKKRHDEIWPELVALLAANGISDYTIYFDPESGQLFAHQHKIGSATTASLNAEPLMKKWFAHMSDLMETNPDGSPLVHPLSEVFHMD